jgi:membrane-associated phospholipid phosphatase
LLRAVAASGASVVPAVVLAFAVRQQFEPVINSDNAAIRAATGFSRSHALTPALVVVQQLAQPVVVYSTCTVGVLRVGRTPELRGRAWWAFVTMMSGWAVGGVSKLLVQRVRPVVDDPLSHSPGYSFPSGHALNIAVAGSAMTALVWPLLERTGRRLAVTVAVVSGLAVGLDRILLGVHFPSDVIAGWLLGLGITVASWMGFTGMRAATSSSAPLRPA